MKENFEEQWAKALKNANEMPPDIVWDNIEAELNKKEKKRIIPIWFLNPWMYSGIAAALIITLGYLIMPSSKQTMAITQNIENNDANNPSNSDFEIKSKGKEAVESNDAKIKEKTLIPEKVKTEKSRQKKLAVARNLSQKINNKNKTFNSNNLSNDLTINKNIGFISNNNEPFLATSTVRNTKTNPGEESSAKKFENISFLEPLGFEKIPIGFILGRNKVEVAEVEQENKAAKQISNTYLSFNSGVAPFNPNVNANSFIGEAVAAARQDLQDGNTFKTANFPGDPSTSQGFAPNVLPSGIPQNTIKAGNSINVGMSIGKKISKRFGIESGLRYLRGNSTMNSNVYTINQSTGKVNSFYQQRYLDSNAEAFQTVISVSENYNQSYNYVSVPLLVSYKIPVYRKFSFELLGGVSGDMFLSSKITNERSEVANLTSQNSNFSAFNISGMESVRLNYSLSNKWQVNLGASNQHAIGSGINSEIDFKPTLFGINYGIKYQLDGR